MMHAVRKQISDLLTALPTVRKPALRRSDTPGFLLATDLPLCADEAAAALFIKQLNDHGITVTPQQGWLLLDVPLTIPQVSHVQAAGELGCLISLLERNHRIPAEPELLRQIARAYDAGHLPSERLWRQLHRAWAQSLRQHLPLPDVLSCLYYIAEKENSR